jgi:hypothetical protein
MLIPGRNILLLKLQLTGVILPEGGSSIHEVDSGIAPRLIFGRRRRFPDSLLSIWWRWAIHTFPLHPFDAFHNSLTVRRDVLVRVRTGGHFLVVHFEFVLRQTFCNQTERQLTSRYLRGAHLAICYEINLKVWFPAGHQ